MGCNVQIISRLFLLVIPIFLTFWSRPIRAGRNEPDYAILGAVDGILVPLAAIDASWMVFMTLDTYSSHQKHSQAHQAHFAPSPPALFGILTHQV